MRLVDGKREKSTHYYYIRNNENCKKNVCVEFPNNVTKIHNFIEKKLPSRCVWKTFLTNSF